MFAHHYLEYISHASSKTVNIFIVINSCYNFHYTLYWAFLHLQLNIRSIFYLTTNNLTLVCLFSFCNLKVCKRAIDEGISGLINYWLKIAFIHYKKTQFWGKSKMAFSHLPFPVAHIYISVFMYGILWKKNLLRVTWVSANDY